MTNVETAFETGKACLLLTTVTAEQAEAVGCEGATHTLRGRNFEIFGTVRAVTGREVNVPGWTKARKGVLSVFTPAVLDETTVPVKGWVGVGPGAPRW